jgi:hypothetical protein
MVGMQRIVAFCWRDLLGVNLKGGELKIESGK